MKIEEQQKTIEELRRCENVKTKKTQRYVKYFLENDENKSIDVKKMVEQNEKLQSFINTKIRLRESELANQTKDGDVGRDWRKRYQDTLQENFVFHALLDRYIEQNSNKDQLLSKLMKETQHLADKDLEIWNLRQELQEKERSLANNIVDLSVLRASNLIMAQNMSFEQGKPDRLCFCTKESVKELRHGIKALQKDGSQVKEKMRKLDKKVFNEGKTAKSLGEMLKGMVIKGKDFDEKIYELADEMRELIIFHEDFTELTNRLDSRINKLEKCSNGKEEHNRVDSIENTRKPGKTSFLRRILKKRPLKTK